MRSSILGASSIAIPAMFVMLFLANSVLSYFAIALCFILTTLPILGFLIQDIWIKRKGGFFE